MSLQWWHEFRALAWSDEILIVCGLLLLLVAVARIVQNSIRMLFWVLLAGLGLAAAAHGSGNAPWLERSLAGVTLEDVVGPGRALSRDVLELLCIRLDEGDG